MIFVVMEKPTEDELLMGFPHGIYKDLVDNVFQELGLSYHYTYLEQNNLSLDDEIKLKDPYIIFLMGLKVGKKVIGKKIKLEDSLGKVVRKYTDDSIFGLVERQFVINYHPSYVLNRGKRELETFKSIFRANV